MTDIEINDDLTLSLRPARVTCHTADCENAGIALELHITDAVACGPCGQPIADVAFLDDDGPASPDQDHSATSLSTT